MVGLGSSCLGFRISRCLPPNIPSNELSEKHLQMGGCQNYGPFSGTRNIRCSVIMYYNRDPKRAHNFDNIPYDGGELSAFCLAAANWERVIR